MISTPDNSPNLPADEPADQTGPDGLTPSQEKAIVALLHERTITKAAETAGVGERTLHRWLDTDAAFARAYRRARRECD